MASIRQEIKNDLEATLRTIKTENGYPLSVAFVGQGTPPNTKKVPILPALFIVSGDSLLQERQMTNMVMREELFGIVGYCRGSDSGNDLEVLASEVEDVLDDDHTRGRKCVMSWVGDMVIVQDVEGDVAIFEMEVHCIVRREHGKP